jgi:hypothetical protein
MTTEISKTRKIIGWIVSGALLALYLFSASGKIMNPEQMQAMGLADWRTLIIIGEISAAVLFFIPKTNLFGTLLLSAYMGGAIIIHMTTDTSILMASLVLVAVWGVAFIRNPELLYKFCKSQMT